MDNLFDGPAAVLMRVFERAGEFGWSLALENHAHLLWWQMPLRVSGRHVGTREIGVLMAVGAFEGVETFAIGAAFDVLEMQVAVIALKRYVAYRMAVHATRMHEDGISSEECVAGSGGVALAGV